MVITARGFLTKSAAMGVGSFASGSYITETVVNESPIHANLR